MKWPKLAFAKNKKKKNKIKKTPAALKCRGNLSGLGA